MQNILLCSSSNPKTNLRYNLNLEQYLIWNDFLLPPLLLLGKGNAIQTLPIAVSNFAGSFTKTMGYDLNFNITNYVTSYYPIHHRTKTYHERYG